VFICLKPRTPYPLLPLTHCIGTLIQYTYTHSHREEGRVEPERRGEGQQGRVQSPNWVENTIHTELMKEIGYLQSVNSDKHLPQSPFTGQFFKMTTFCIDFYESYLSTVLGVNCIK
jgi:hypothetical protein